MPNLIEPLDIQFALKKAGYTQSAIAEICEVKKSVVSRVIQGTTTSHNVRCTIAKAIGKKPEDLWHIPENPNKPGPRKRGIAQKR
ncbi:helix-turn-helix domain-containing protein [Desulfosediminicola sp.]|uniref:helix-turn-helix domain-containing protein n=1 Tax=Desulfosediminicola sp. TaxID=2886825 RepID=UPI003AF2301A